MDHLYGLTERWRGEDQLVIALHLGATKSVASILHCRNGEHHNHDIVSCWPSQPKNPELPSRILYNSEGRCVAVGGETEEEVYKQERLEGKLKEVKGFKLLLCEQVERRRKGSRDVVKRDHGYDPPSYDEYGGEVGGIPKGRLPHGVTVTDCYRDVIRYLYDQTLSWWHATHSRSSASMRTWTQCSRQVKLIVTHPPDWEEDELRVLRDAVVDSQVMMRSELEQRLSFLSEAVASTFWVAADLHEGSPKHWLQPDHRITVLDAGGSTINLTSLVVKAVLPRVKLQAVGASYTSFIGGSHIDETARHLIEPLLLPQHVNSPKYLEALMETFREDVKLNFRSLDSTYKLKFDLDGDPHLKGDHYSIRSGSYKLTGLQVSHAFEATLAQIAQSTLSHARASDSTTILVFGGLSDSSHLDQRLELEAATLPSAERPVIWSFYQQQPISVHFSTVVGALFHYIHHLSVLRSSYSIGISLVDNHTSSSANASSKASTPSGDDEQCGSWIPLLAKGIELTPGVAHRAPPVSVTKYSKDSAPFQIRLLQYSDQTTERKAGNRAFDESGDLLPGFSEICTLETELSSLQRHSEVLKDSAGAKYQVLNFEIGIMLAKRSLEVFEIYDKKGKEKRGSALALPQHLLTHDQNINRCSAWSF